MRPLAAITAMVVASLGFATPELLVLVLSLTALGVGTTAMIRSDRTDRKVETFLDEQRQRIQAQGDEIERRLDGG